MVSWVAAELLRTGLGRRRGARGAGCGPAPRFAYRISRSAAELRAGARSRYYPVELSGVLAEIRATPGRYAVVGVPCFVKAIHLLRAADPLLAERIAFTLGLFCGHMKSARMIESFAWQMQAELDQATRIEYRAKDAGPPGELVRRRARARDGRAVSQPLVGHGRRRLGRRLLPEPGLRRLRRRGRRDGRRLVRRRLGRALRLRRSRHQRRRRPRAARCCELIEAARGDGRLALEPVDADFVASTQAAGLRHRREGLAYRLTWRRRGPASAASACGPAAPGLPLRRRLVYRARHANAVWSHRVFWLARATRLPRLYLAWARLALAAYQGLTYSRGRIGRLLDRLLPADNRPG